MPYQVLTSQFQSFDVKKYRIFYDDWIPFNNTRQYVELEEIPRTYEIMYAKMWLREQFSAPSLSQCLLYCMQGSHASPGSEINKSPIRLDGLQPSGDNVGKVGFSDHYIGNQSSPNMLTAALRTNSISGGAVFTAGEIDLWIAIAKMS